MPTVPKKRVSLCDVPSGTVLECQVFKPHKADIQIIVVAPSGDYWPIFQALLSDADKIARNAAGDDLPDLPVGWDVTTKEEREARRKAVSNKDPEV